MAAQHHGRRLVLQFGCDTQRELGADALRATDGRLVRQSQSAFELARRQSGQNIERNAAADILHGLQKAEPFALLGRMKAIETNCVVRHFGLDHQRNMRTGHELGESRAGTVDEIADAADV